MKKVILAIVVVAAIAAAVYFWKKGQTAPAVNADGTATKPGGAGLPPAATPPTVPNQAAAAAAAVSMFNGTGADAIEARKKELRKSSAYYTAMNASGAASTLFAGIPDGFKDFFMQYSGGLTVADTVQIPAPSDNGGFWPGVEVLKKVELDGSDTWNTVFKIRSASDQMYDRAGLALFSGTPDDWKFKYFGSKELYGSGYGKNGMDNGEFKRRVSNAVPMVRRFGKNLTDAAGQVDAELRKMAVADLRAAGWRFIGIDA